jgi:hypothetical protein
LLPRAVEIPVRWWATFIIVVNRYGNLALDKIAELSWWIVTAVLHHFVPHVSSVLRCLRVYKKLFCPDELL